MCPSLGTQYSILHLISSILERNLTDWEQGSLRETEVFCTDVSFHFLLPFLYVKESRKDSFARKKFFLLEWHGNIQL